MTADLLPVRRALLSVSDKTGLVELATALAARGVSILTQYSDHANHLILLTDDDKLAAEITEPWATNVKDELTP